MWSKWSRSKWSKSISETRSKFTIYKQNIYIIVADFDNQFSILTNDQNDQNDHDTEHFWLLIDFNTPRPSGFVCTRIMSYLCTEINRPAPNLKLPMVKTTFAQHQNRNCPWSKPKQTLPLFLRYIINFLHFDAASVTGQICAKKARAGGNLCFLC